MTTSPTAVGVQPADLELELERHRRSLTGYCYRMLGSAFEAEDAVQETLIRAWRGADRYEGRAPFRSWLFRIATNVCFDMLNGRRRRAMPMDLAAPSPGDHEVTGPATEVLWLQPMPDSRIMATDDPAEKAAAHESVRLAFIAALQHLQPRPRAVLILRDVLAWQATEVADLLGVTPTSVHSMLRRARQTLTTHRSETGADAVDEGLLARYVDAFKRYDIDTLVSLLRDDATFSMPPNPQWMRGPAAVRRWWQGAGSECNVARLLRTRANGAGAFGLYRPAAGGGHEAFGIQVVETSAGSIVGIHTFIEPALFSLFGLPPAVA